MHTCIKRLLHRGYGSQLCLGTGAGSGIAAGTGTGAGSGCTGTFVVGGGS